MIQIKQDELKDFCWCSMRYALGRKTYVVNVICDLLLKYGCFLESHIKERLAQEIQQAIESDNAGMACDIAEWQKVIKEFEK